MWEVTAHSTGLLWFALTLRQDIFPAGPIYHITYFTGGINWKSSESSESGAAGLREQKVSGLFDTSNRCLAQSNVFKSASRRKMDRQLT